MTVTQSVMESFGSLTVRAVTSVGRLGVLFAETLSWTVRDTFRVRFRVRETLYQMYLAAVESLPIIGVSLAFTSLMLVTEFSFHMKLVLHQDSLVPAFSTILLLRELGPVLTSLLIASRVGAGYAAEIGTMKITEQLDALTLMGLDPVEYLTVPRWIACVFACVALSIISLGISILGGSVMASLTLGYTVGEYFNTMFTFAKFSDFAACGVKALVFGSIIPIVASSKGFRCRAGSEGVGEAATQSVVQSSMWIIAADFLLTYLMYG